MADGAPNGTPGGTPDRPVRVLCWSERTEPERVYPPGVYPPGVYPPGVYPPGINGAVAQALDAAGGLETKTILVNASRRAAGRRAK
ncbi:MAG: hypothetical protein M3442_03410 [Chloroflexota bacterium]|nr:hypothetical protein [Chloroflexota bacterium]